MSFRICNQLISGSNHSLPMMTDVIIPAKQPRFESNLILLNFICPRININFIIFCPKKFTCKKTGFLGTLFWSRSHINPLGQGYALRHNFYVYIKFNFFHSGKVAIKYFCQTINIFFILFRLKKYLVLKTLVDG